MRRHEASDAAIARRAAELDGNGFESDGYLIRPAATVREIFDEANAQHNCVAGFIDKYASGQTDLWLMQKCSDPGRPLETVEVRGGAIRQAFQSHNRQVTAAQRGFLADWCEAVGYNMPSGGRMRTLGAWRETNDTHGWEGLTPLPKCSFRGDGATRAARWPCPSAHRRRMARGGLAISAAADAFVRARRVFG